MSWLELGAYNGYQGLNYVILDVYRGFNKEISIYKSGFK